MFYSEGGSRSFAGLAFAILPSCASKRSASSSQLSLRAVSTNFAYYSGEPGFAFPAGRMGLAVSVGMPHLRAAD